MAKVHCSGKSRISVLVALGKGEHLHYRVEVQGATPQFDFGCAHRESIRKPEDFPGHPMNLYEWDYLRNPGDADAPTDEGDVYGLSMLFLAASRYHVTIEHRKSDGSVIAVLSDLVCESGDATGIARRGLEIFCV